MLHVYYSMMQDLEQETQRQQGAIVTPQQEGDYATSLLTQMRHVAKRTLLNSIRNPASTIVQVGFNSRT